MNSIVNKLIAENEQKVSERAMQDLGIDVNDNRYSKIGWSIVIFGVLGFLLWASFAPLDKGVPLSGTVASEGNRKWIQHQTGGIVDEILVKDGQVVAAGQELVRMNNVVAKSNLETLKAQYFAALASESRLLSESQEAKDVRFPKELLDQKNSAQVGNAIALQNQLFYSRQNALSSELSGYEESMSGLKIQLQSIEESMKSKKQQAGFLKEQLDGVRELAKDGYVARNRLLELERTYSQVLSSISDDSGTMGRVSKQISEIKMRSLQRKQTYQTEVRTTLAEIQKELSSTKARLSSLEFEVKNVLVKAPVAGTIVGMSVFTNGAVIPSGFKLMELVPKNDALIVEGMLPVQLVDKVTVGLKVEFIFSAFNTNTTPHIPGVITHVAADRNVDEHSGQPYYKVKAEVTPEGEKLLGKLQVRAGMPVELFVKTGERTMMNYLMKPVFDRAKTSMKEE
jgi:protease secretion system membrane fusion protein